MINILISDELRDLVDASLIENTARKILARMDYSPEEVTLTVVIDNDETLRKLNLQYLGIDKTTDVLSFEINEKDPDSGTFYLGDIVISFQRASEQALTAGHSTEGELMLLLIHGILHLVGYDHVLKSDKKQMWILQRKLLSDLGFGTINMPS